MSDARLKSIEEKLDALLHLSQQNANNIIAVYRRTTALAYMIEALSQRGELQTPTVMRAEIDASLNPEEFAALYDKDPDEFVKRYGPGVKEIVAHYGAEAISTMGELTQKLQRVVN